MDCGCKGIDREINGILDALVRFRREMHAHPELAMQEEKTSKLVYDTLLQFGIESRYIEDGKGVHLLIEGGLPGDTVVLRADMDALPVQEKSDLDFRSQNDGVMHACGHDLNTTYLLGAAVVLSRMRERLRGNVKCVFQCGEETFQGAKAALAAGVLDGVKPKYQFAFHAHSDYAAGDVGIRQGEAMAASDTLRILVKGKGGHAGYPHLTIDPVAVSAHIVLALQTLAARRHHPADPLVITVGSIHGGKASNVTPDEVEMSGTIRYFNKELGEQLPGMIEELCRSTAAAHGAKCEVSYERLCPALIGNDAIFRYAHDALCRGLGKEAVCIAPKPAMGSEDFAMYLPYGPAMQIRIGTRFDDPKSALPLHNGAVVFSEDSIPVGVKAACLLAGAE